MTNTTRKQISIYWIITVIVAIVAILAGLLLWKPWVTNTITTFQACKDAGGALLESYPERCMIHGNSFTNMAQSTTGNVGSYIGLTEQAALDRAKSDNKPARVIERDGEALPVTMDYNPDRLNLSVKDGKVYKVQIEGERSPTQ